MPSFNSKPNSNGSNSAVKSNGTNLNHVRPHSIEAERALLGAMLITSEAAAVGIEIIKSSDYFFHPPHREIFEVMLLIYERGGAIDYLLVSEHLESSGSKVDKAELFKMRGDAPAPSHAKDYAKLVREDFIRRNLQGAAEGILDLVTEGREMEIDDLINEAEGLIYKATQERLTTSTNHFGILYQDYVRHLEELYDRGGSITGLATGFHDLDVLLSGLQRQNLIIVGARPAQGKTSLALGIASHIAKVKPVLFFSMEMSSLEITRRIVAQQTAIRTDKLQTGKLTEQEWQSLAGRMAKFSESQFWIDDNPALKVSEVRSKALRLKAELGDIGAIFVDYMQLMTSPTKSENRQVEVSEISRGLKILAREIDCPVVVLSQLSRGVESRADKSPLLADLRESGSIEQDADVVVFLYRDDVYTPDSDQQNIVEVTVAKHRSGPTGRMKLRWFGEYTTFQSLASGNQVDATEPAEDEHLI